MRTPGVELIRDRNGAFATLTGILCILLRSMGAVGTGGAHRESDRFHPEPGPNIMKQFKKILFVVDPERSCRAAVARAVALAENSQAELTFLDVLPSLDRGLRLLSGVPSAADVHAAVLARREQRLASLVKSFGRRLKIQTRVRVGTAHLEVIREVLASGHDLVMRPPEDPNWLDGVLGSDDMNLLRKCPCPVWLIKCKRSRSFKRILAAVDVEDADQPGYENSLAMNRRILEMAVSLALSEFAELHLLHVWDAPGEALMRGTMVSVSEARVAAYVEQVRERSATNLDALLRESTEVVDAQAMAYLKPTTHLVKGAPRRAIPMMAKRLKADLILMGTVARTGIGALLMGNTAETILRQVDCSVLAVKPSGFVTPVILDR